jgi:hypothetical protein
MNPALSLVLVLAASLSGCGLEHNYGQTGVYARPIMEVLISRGLCSGLEDCNHKEMVLAEGGTFKSSPVHLNVYNVSDPEIAEAIVQAARLARPNAIVGLSLRITASRHLDTPYKSLRREAIE